MKRRSSGMPSILTQSAPAGGIWAPLTLPSRFLGRKRGSMARATPTLFREAIHVKADADQQRLADPRDAEVLARCSPGCPNRSVVPNDETHFGLIQ